MFKVQFILSHYSSRIKGICGVERNKTERQREMECERIMDHERDLNSHRCQEMEPPSGPLCPELLAASSSCLCAAITLAEVPCFSAVHLFVILGILMEALQSWHNSLPEVKGKIDSQ